MRDEILKQLRREQYAQEAMVPHTVRIPREISDEIKDFSGQTGIRIATIWRKCLLLGWEELNK